MRIAILFLMLNSCVTIQHGPYNREPIQDPTCWAKYGAAIGYCGLYPDR